MKRYKFQQNTLLGLPLQNEFHHIIGGGIAGLLLGFHLKQKNIPFKIYEKSDRVGGLLQSYWSQHGLVEKSANGFLWNQEMQDLCDVLGLKIMTPSEKSKARFIIRNKRFRRMPVGPMELVKSSLKLFRKNDAKPETIEDFGRIYFGEKVTRNVLEPALMGIYGAGVAELSFPAVLPSFAKSLNENQSIGTGLWKRRFSGKKKKKTAVGTHSFENGMQELVDALADYLKNEIELNSEVEELPKDNSVLLCTPAHVSKELLNNSLQDSFAGLSYVSMLSCCVFVEKSKIPKRKNGFGCLIPRNEGLRLLGVLYNDCIFENRSRNSEVANLTCMFRDFNGDLLQKSDAEIQAMIEKELGILLGLKAAPLSVAVHRWKEAIPLYSPTLYEARFEMNERLIESQSRVRLFGNFSGQVSIRGMCEEAKKIVDAIE